MVGDCVPRRTLLIAIFRAGRRGLRPDRNRRRMPRLASLQKRPSTRPFRIPPDEAKPWAYWWWLKGNVSEGSITRDLEAMKRMGFAGLLMFDARGYHEDHVPPPEPHGLHGSRVAADAQVCHFGGRSAGLQTSVNLSSCGGTQEAPGSSATMRFQAAPLDEPGNARADFALAACRSRGRPKLGVALVAVRHAESNPAAA